MTNSKKSAAKEDGKRAAPFVKQAPKATCSGTKVVDNLVFKVDPRIGVEHFTVIVGTKSQMTVHRPIGVTQLGKDEWVMTPTAEMHYLVNRKSSKELDMWSTRRKEELIRNLYLSGDYGRASVTEGKSTKYVYAKSKTDVALARKAAEAEAKVAEDKKSNFLKYMSDDDRQDELKWRKALETESPGTEWSGLNPKPQFTTVGGFARNCPQTALAGLKGLSLEEAQAEFFCVAFREPVAVAPENNVPGSRVSLAVRGK